jgi:hypothetical protein
MNFIKNGLRGGNSSSLKMGVEVRDLMATVWRHGGFELLPFFRQTVKRKTAICSHIFPQKKKQHDLFNGIVFVAYHIENCLSGFPMSLLRSRPWCLIHWLFAAAFCPCWVLPDPSMDWSKGKS